MKGSANVKTIQGQRLGRQNKRKTQMCVMDGAGVCGWRDIIQVKPPKDLWKSLGFISGAIESMELFSGKNQDCFLRDTVILGE